MSQMLDGVGIGVGAILLGVLAPNGLPCSPPVMREATLLAEVSRLPATTEKSQKKQGYLHRFVGLLEQVTRQT